MHQHHDGSHQETVSLGPSRRSGRRRLLARIRPRLSYANVVASIALFGVLAGGGAYAASQVGPKEIKKNAVRAKHIKKDQVKAKHVAKNAVRTSKIADGAVTAAKLADGVDGVPGPQGPAGAKGDTGPSGFAADCNEGLAANDVVVRVGSVCVDRYEASLWTARTGGTQIIVTEESGVPCSPNGQDCTNIYARSVPGVEPVRYITWFQAQQALANSGKRLPTNAEWQMAVAGTPGHPGPCNTTSGLAPVDTGSAAGCISNHGVNDMVGNVHEWVADWDEQTTGFTTWSSAYGGDRSAIGQADGSPSTKLPAALLRGGSFEDGTRAGPFEVSANSRPSGADELVGFRGAR